MRIRLIAMFIMICLFPYTVYANGLEWDKLDQISDEALQLTKNDRLQEAKQLLEYFEKQFALFREDIHSMDVIYVLTATHEEALRAVTASSVPTEQRINQLTQFRLAVDAVQAKHQPLWKEMKYAVMSAFDKMKQAMEQEDEQSFQQAFHQFLQRYELIEPSVKINADREQVQRVSAHISLLEAPAFRQLHATERMKELRQMEEDLQVLFADGKKETTLPSLWWVMTSIGGMIIMTLTYVGWRKYRGEKEGKMVRDKQ